MRIFRFLQILIKIFLLLRRQCNAYRDFALYCSAHSLTKESVKGGTPSPASKKVLASPDLPPATKLSPLSSLHHNSPALFSEKKTPEPVIKESKKLVKSKLSSEKQAESEPGTSPIKQAPTPISIPKDLIPDDPKGDASTPKDTGMYPTLNKAKRTPFIDPSKLMASPITNTEVVRRERSIVGGGGFLEEVKRVTGNITNDDKPNNLGAPDSFSKCTESGNSPKGNSILLCGCGNVCHENETLCESCLERFKGITCSGYLYENAPHGTLVRKWYKLVGNQLYRIFSSIIILKVMIPQWKINVQLFIV